MLFGFPCDFFQLYWFSLFPCVFHTPSICIEHMARHFCCAVFANEAMKYKGLVDPKNKPFGNLLPFEVQVIIMFWTRCFMTNDRRTKMNEELTRLPCCLCTSIPMSVAFSFSSGYKRFPFQTLSSLLRLSPLFQKEHTTSVGKCVHLFPFSFISCIPLRFFLFLVD